MDHDAQIDKQWWLIFCTVSTGRCGLLLVQAVVHQYCEIVRAGCGIDSWSYCLVMLGPYSIMATSANGTDLS